MKKLFALVALVLGVVSCQTDPNDLDVVVGGDQDVMLTVSLPEATRASSANGFQIADLGSTYDLRYILEVYRAEDEDNILYEKCQRQVKRADAATMSFPVRLAPGYNYQIVAWADIVDNGSDADRIYKTTDGLDAIEVISWNAMDETRDAYAGTKYISNFSSSSDLSMELTRPFAKVRVVATDIEDIRNVGLEPTSAEVLYLDEMYTKYNAVTAKADVTSAVADKSHSYSYTTFPYTDATGEMTLFADYVFIPASGTAKFTLEVFDQNGKSIKENSFNTEIFVERNKITTIKGDVLTEGGDVNVGIEDEFGGESGIEDGKTFAKVDTAEEFLDAINKGIEKITLEGDIDLNTLLTAGTLSTRAATDPTLTIDYEAEIDLNGKTLSATSEATGKNYNMFVVKKGNLTMKNGTIVYEHKGNNMEWNNSTNIFHVEDATLNLNGVTAKNLGGSDMGFVAHLNNWGEVTLNVENSTLESNYIAVRVFNSGNDMNNVTIKNSTLQGGSYAFWVHNYTLADFGNDADKTAKHKALLNLNIYDQGNTFVPDVNGIIYGYTNYVESDSCGITKSVSEDGTEVTLGSLFENGIIRRNVAGAEGNNTIKEVVVEEGVGVLYDRTFRRFYALESVELPSTLTTIGAAGTGVFQSCSALKNINIPASVTTIGVGTFNGCRALESIEIPTGVTRIEDDCLRETGLKKVVFHEGVTYFGKQAFRDCENLEEIYINAPSFTIESNTFLNAAAPYPHFTIYVVNAEMKAYLESVFDAHTKTFITVKAPEVVADKSEIEEALDSALESGDTNVIIDANGANIGDLNYGLSASKIPAGTTVTIRNAEVSGKSYGNGVDGTVIFEGCTFNNSGAYSIHFDSGSGDVIFKNCHLYGWNSFGSSLNSVTFENCSLHGNGNYALIRSYVDLTLTDCTIDVSNANHTDVYSEGVEAVNDATLTMTNTKYEASNSNGLKAAVAAGAPVVGLKAGVYETKDFSFNGKTLTLVGIEDGAKIFNSQDNAVASGAFDGCKMTFENLTIETRGGIYKGFARMEGVYKNCNFVNNYFTFFGKHEFVGCKFDAPATPTNEHCLWTYGASELYFTECEFNYNDRCINCYSDNDVPGGQTVNFTKCTFTTTNTASEGAVEINSTYITGGIVVNLDGCTAPAYGELAYISPWDSTNGAKTTINIQ